MQQKSIVMYKKIQENPIINDLWIIRFDVLSSDSKAKFECEHCFPKELNNNSVIIYSPSDDGIVVLGYFNLDNLSITSSSLFEQIRNITLSFNGIDNIEQLSQIKCSHICSWVFDDSLRTNKHLNKIVESIVIKSKKSFLLWYEYHDELIFYPLENYYLAIDYFVKAFSKKY